ncbi:hypothetical protein Tco_0755832 [Tanacetum coccineum]
MRLNELHKFSDGTLTRVMEKLDQMVKDFHLFEYNKGMETRKWSEDDKRRSKDFITAIEKRLQIRRIYRSLESFVGGRIRDIDYRLINRTTNPKMIADMMIDIMDHSDACTTIPSHSRILKDFCFHFSRRLNTLSIDFLNSELVDIEQVASVLPTITKTKTHIESRAKRSSINLNRTHIQFSCFHTLWKQVDPKSPTHYPVICSEHPSDEKIAVPMNGKILLEPHQNKL